MLFHLLICGRYDQSSRLIVAFCYHQPIKLRSFTIFSYIKYLYTPLLSNLYNPLLLLSSLFFPKPPISRTYIYTPRRVFFVYPVYYTTYISVNEPRARDKKKATSSSSSGRKIVKPNTPQKASSRVFLSLRIYILSNLGRWPRHEREREKNARWAKTESARDAHSRADFRIAAAAAAALSRYIFR